MQAPVKKQYLHLAGLPLLCHTLMAFDRCGDLDQICLVVPGEDLEKCKKDVLEPLSPVHDIQLLAGGKRRQESVVNGLKSLKADRGIVMIHDGVRPFVRAALIERCLTGVKATGACIPAIPATDTLKQVDATGVIVSTVARQTIRLAQTPQTFSIDLIRRAHHHAALENVAVTDDASVAEHFGASVMAVPGDPDNIKITTPHDLIVAQAILKRWTME